MDEQEFFPLFERVVVRRIEGEPREQGGIEIPVTQRDKPQVGEIIAIAVPSEEMRKTPEVPCLEPGIRVLFGKYAGVEQTLNGVECVVMHYRELLGFFRPRQTEI